MGASDQLLTIENDEAKMMSYLAIQSGSHMSASAGPRESLPEVPHVILDIAHPGTNGKVVVERGDCPAERTVGRLGREPGGKLGDNLHCVTSLMNLSR